MLNPGNFVDPIAKERVLNLVLGEPSTRFWAKAIGWPIASLACITLVKLLASKYIGQPTPYLLYYVAIIVATWFGGWWSGLITTVASTVLVNYYFTQPAFELSVPSLAVTIRSTVFLMEGCVITWMVAWRRSANRKAIASAHNARASVAKLHGVLDGVTDAISVQNAQGELIYANEAAARLSGFASVEEFLACPTAQAVGRFEIFDERGAELQVSELPGRWALKGVSIPERLIRFKERGKTQEKWAVVRANPIKFGDSDVHYAVNVFRDVTAARTQEEAIRLQQEWLSTTLRSIGDAVIATDAGARIMFMNPVAESLTGWTAQEANGKPLAEVFKILHEVTRQTMESPVDHVIRDKVVVGSENHTLLISRNGHRISIDDSAAPIRGAAGDVVGAVLVFRDVSEKYQSHRRAEFISRATAELASSLDYKQTLTTVTRLAVPIIADWCTVDVVDDGALRRVAVHHIDPKKLEFLFALQNKYPEDANAHGAAQEILRTGKPIFHADISDTLISAASRDAEHRELLRQLQLRSFIGVPLLAGGKVKGVITLAMAESGRKHTAKDLDVALALADRAALAIDHALLFMESIAARAEAEQANRAKDEFLAMLGHELRNPLAPILTALQLMKLRSVGTVDREREVLERQVKHVVALVDDLLDISRITQGKISYEKKSVDLFAVVTRALEVTGPLLTQKRHVVTCEIPQGMWVNGDAVRLTQVFSNLLTNAAKYTPNGGRIGIYGKRGQGNMEVTVSDNGAGISPDLLPRLFDLFVQGEQPLDRAKGGLGLGLAIVRRLIQLHGGRVWVKSEGLGHGSEFTVVLPALEQVPESSGPHLQIEKADQKYSAAKILLVDDNEDALELLGEALGLLGYSVRTANSSLSALQIAQDFKPQIALLDLGLPGLNGYELAERLRAMDALKETKIVALTGYGQPSDRERTAAAGFDEHLVKPISIDQVQHVLERLSHAGTAAEANLPS